MWKSRDGVRKTHQNPAPPFETIDDLPAALRDWLNDRQARVFLVAWNNACSSDCGLMGAFRRSVAAVRRLFGDNVANGLQPGKLGIVPDDSEEPDSIKKGAKNALADMTRAGEVNCCIKYRGFLS